MCGRFNVTSDPLNQLIVEITGRGFVVENHFNIAPTEQVPVLKMSAEGEWEMADMRWWLVPYWSDGPSTKYSMFNAKSETLGKSRAFREPFARRRCVIPATGYYEWRKEGTQKVPFYITPQSHEGFALAGLWDCWKGEGQEVFSCTIVTAAAPDAMQSIHARIPVHLAAREIETWMDPAASPDVLAEMLGLGLRAPVEVTPVSTYVNNARNKDERCIEPLADSFVLQ